MSNNKSSFSVSQAGNLVDQVSDTQTRLNIALVLLDEVMKFTEGRFASYNDDEAINIVDRGHMAMRNLIGRK
jgi:hypothetical protein